jgi:Spy/CpxP family protein refolding chaperone
MRRFGLMLCVFSALAFVAVPPRAVSAAPEGGDAAKAEARILRSGARIMGSTLEEMVQTLALTEEQQTQVKEKLLALGKADAAWQAENGEKLKELRAAVTQAQKGGDNKEAMKKALGDRKALEAGRTAVVAPLKKAVLAVLTPEQLAKWNAMQLATMVTRRWRKVELTEKQSADILALCEKALKANPELNLSERKTVYPVVKAIADKAYTDILTEEQRAKVAKPKATTRDQPKKPKKVAKPKKDA